MTKKPKMQRKEKGYRNNQNCSCYQKGFLMPQAYGKAIMKLKIKLSKSPSERVEPVMRLVNEVGLKQKESDFNRNTKKYGGLFDEVKTQVVDFYYQTDVI